MPIAPVMAQAGTTPLRVREAAELLGVSPATVRRWADNGRLVSRRTRAGERRFRADDLELRPAETQSRAPAAADAERRYQLLLDTSLELASSLDLDEVLQSAALRLGTALDIPDCDFYEVDGPDKLLCVASSSKGRFDNAWAGRVFSLDELPSARLAVEGRRAVAFDNLDDPRLNEREREYARAYGQQSFIVLPLIARDEVIGTIELLDHVPRRFTKQEIGVAEGVAKLVALAMEHARLYDEIRRLHLANLRALSSALSAKDYYTLGHASRVAGYAALLGSELGWSEERLAELQNAAFLHDIGKIGVSDRVLLKAGPLSSEEWELVRQHPGISAEIAQPLFSEELVEGIRHHHEHYDGGGYPSGLAAEDIPEVARVLCVVDCYDAMSSERPYRRALSYRQCLAELRRAAGTQFDPGMVGAFLGALRRLRRRRTEVDRLAAQAAALIDPAAHVLLRSRDDEERPEYARMVEDLRAFRDQHPPIRFVTSFSSLGDHVISVLDTGESDADISHVGDHWIAQDELAAVLAGQRCTANVLNADDFGVWVTGTAPIRLADGTVTGAVTVDVPALEWAPLLQSDQSHTLTAIVRAATIRFSRAEVEAITDGLTGLYNHRYLHERLEEELQRAERYDDKISLLFVDCDDFKGFNDAYGHKAGDQALARIARVLESCSRRIDLAARYGGEEFVLVLVGTGPAGARTVAERVRAEVAASSLAAGQQLTVSVGVAAYPRDAAGKDELLDKADWAMYAAKRAGRDGVVSFRDDVVAKDWTARTGGRSRARNR
jgi:diguanylate cyclase (GGDEF)-like protein/excisionase family DNA binding protein